MQNKTLNERKSIYANSNLSGFQYSFTHQMTTLNTSETSKLKEKKKSKTYNKESHYLKHIIFHVINSKYYKTVNLILTLFSLYSNDFKMLVTNQNADPYFDGYTIIMIILFFAEIIVLFIFDDYYGCSLYFWIDVFGAGSLFLEIQSITTKFQNTFNTEYCLTLNSVTLTVTRFLKGFRTMRIVRLIKIADILYRKNDLNRSPYSRNKVSLSTGEGEERLSTKFESLIFKNLVALIFFMLIGIYVFNPEIYVKSLTKNEFSFQIFNEFSGKNYTFSKTIYTLFIQDYQADSDTPLMFTKIYNYFYLNEDFDENLRDTEKTILFDDCPDENGENLNIKKGIENNYNKTKYDMLMAKGEIPTSNEINDKCYAMFNNKKFTKKTSLLSIIKTTVVLCAFSFGFLLIGRDTKVLIISPIENMTKKIKLMAQNPILTMQNGEDEIKTNEDKQNIIIKQMRDKCCPSQKQKMYETALLQKKISKICSLLVLGFGEAGAETISSVLKEGVDAEMNPLMLGKKMLGIFGFCDIRNFTDTTDVLKEKVMIFVNEVAEIVHELVNDFCGSANKNIGDAFLLVWKFEERFNNNLKLKKCKEVSRLCDMALISFLLIIINVQKSAKLNEYRKHKNLNERMNNYSVKLGFGLHLGYAIEGAIGSLFKIDASYLSHDVDMANKLEEKTKDFGKELILSGDLVDYLTEDSKKYVRLLDQVKYKDGEKVRYYTVDMNLAVLETHKMSEEEKEANESPNVKLEKVMQRRKRAKYLYKKVMDNKIIPWKRFENNRDFVNTRKLYTGGFIDNYNRGMEMFIKGEWRKAEGYFLKADVSLFI